MYEILTCTTGVIMLTLKRKIFETIQTKTPILFLFQEFYNDSTKRLTLLNN